MYDYTAAWSTRKESRIMVSANKIFKDLELSSIKDILHKQVNRRQRKLEKKCDKVSLITDNQSEGAYQEGVNYANIEVTINCYKGEKLKDSIKIETYVLYTRDYKYRFGIDAKATEYEKDQKDFEEVLNSFSYIK